MSWITIAFAWLNPPSKLEANFPWTMQTAGKRYMSALFYFAIGSFAIPMMVLAPVWALAYYEQVLLSLTTVGGLMKVLAGAWLVGALLSTAIYGSLLRYRGAKLNFTSVARLAATAVMSGLATAWLLVAGIELLHPVYPQVIRWVIRLLCEDDGKPRMSFVMSLSLVSFVCGFGLQMWYIARSLRKDGQSFSTAMGLNIEKRRGSWWLPTLFNVIWPVAVAYWLFQPIGDLVEMLLGSASQPTVEMARQASGGDFLMFALMAVVGAPIFEEIVFRGFIFQMIRSSLRREATSVKLTEVPEKGRWLGLRQMFIRFDNTLRLWAHGLSNGIRSLLGGSRTEFTAVVLSSMLFSVMHLQFHPTTLVLLFLLGCVHAELYRRTGSLYCSMLLHATNNGIEVLRLAMG